MNSSIHLTGRDSCFSGNAISQVIDGSLLETIQQIIDDFVTQGNVSLTGG